MQRSFASSPILAGLICCALSGCGSDPGRSAAEPSGAPTPAPGSSGTQGGRPDWLPGYSAAQQALLDTPTGIPVKQRATPTYPRLDQFTYAANPAVFDAERARASAVAAQQQVAASALLYVIGEVPAELENRVAQYGPPAPAEPDPWVRAAKQSDGRYELAWAAPGDELRPTIDAGNAALTAGDLATAEQKFEQAASRAAGVPALWTTLAEVRASRGNDPGAEQAAMKALAADPRFPEGHRVMAEVFFRRGNRALAIEATARALALYPTSARAWELARRLGPIGARPVPPALFLEVTGGGAIQVGVVGGENRKAYGTCRAAVRYEPQFRAKMLGLPGRYQLSVGEELMCLEALLGSYLGASLATSPPVPPPPAAPAGASASAGPPLPPTPPATSGSAAAPPPQSAAVSAPEQPRDPELEQLLDIARGGALAEYALFEIIGPHRPEWLRVAPDGVHEALVTYLKARVLPSP